MLIYGHGTDEPNNLLNGRESFQRLNTLGIDGVELDVRLSKDEKLLVIHDHEFEDGRPVTETLSAERPAEVLLLDEALDLCSGLIVNIEIKNYPSDPAFDITERISDRVLEQLKGRGFADEVLISSFGIGCLDRIRVQSPQTHTAHLVLSRRPANEVVLTCVEHGHSVIHPYVSMVNPTFMDIARDLELTVNVWTGFDEAAETLQAMVDLHVDGLITGDPETARLIALHGTPTA